MLHATLIRAALWTTQLPGYWYEASPNAYGGNVFIVGNGGLSAVDETSGNILWTTTSAGSTDWDSPAISSEGAYAEAGNCLAGAYNPSSGASIWQVQSQCSGTWGYTSIIKNGVFFGRTGGSLTLFVAATGNQKGQVASALARRARISTSATSNAGVIPSPREVLATSSSSRLL